MMLGATPVTFSKNGAASHFAKLPSAISPDDTAWSLGELDSSPSSGVTYPDGTDPRSFLQGQGTGAPPDEARDCPAGQVGRDHGSVAQRQQSKPCMVCGRTIEWRAKWAGDWDQVRYCSQRCRRRKLGPLDDDLTATILRLLDARRRGATICPSEAARAVAGHDDDGAWRELMEPARMAARRLVAEGRAEITQRGRVVDPSSAKGPIRIRLVDR